MLGALAGGAPKRSLRRTNCRASMSAIGVLLIGVLLTGPGVLRCSLLDRSSEAFTGICNPAQHGLGCAFIHLLNVGDQAILPRGGLSRLGGQGHFAHRVWWKPFGLFLGLSSEAFISISHPTQHVLGYTFIHLLGASEHLFCTTMPMHRIVVRHA
jgi:hypothetical protein